MTSSFDLVIVGGGIVGVMTATLARRALPEQRILLLDQALVGSGTTRYSGGHRHPWGNSPEQKEMAAVSEQIFAKLEQVLPDLPLRTTGLYGVVDQARLAPIVDGYLQPQQMQVVGAQGVADVQRWCAGFRHEPHQTVITGHSSGYGLTGELTQRLADAFRREAGCAIWESTQVSAVQEQGDQVNLRLSDGRDLVAGSVVLATGPWLETLAQPLVKPHGIRVKKVVAMHVNRVPTADAPILYFYDDDAYLIPCQERGHWIFSFTSPDWDVAPQPHTWQVSANDRDIALTILDRYCPAWHDDCQGARMFCDGYAADRDPVVALLPNSRRIVGALAGGGFGFRLAPWMGLTALQRLGHLGNDLDNDALTGLFAEEVVSHG